MRLTLRTVLAWIDGVMSDEEAAAFGRKVEGSTVAKTIVDRIRSLIEHPGIDAPRIDGRGLGADANTVAEYLTNGLPAESVAAFERVCLESDAHLAEVAASHRLLAEARDDDMILMPPDPATRARLLEVIRSASTREPVPSVQPAARAPVVVPPPRGSRSIWTAVSAVLVLALLLGLLVWNLFPKGLAVREPRQVAQAVPDRPVAPAEPLADSVPPPAPPAPAEESPAPSARPDDLAAAASVAAEGVQEKPPAEDAPSVPTPPVAETAKPASPAPEPAEPPATGARVPGGEALAIGAARPQRPAEPAAPKPPDGPPPERTDLKPVAVAGSRAFFLSRPADDEAAEWRAVGPGGAIEDGADTIVPPGVHPTIEIGGITIALEPSTRFVVASAPEGPPRLEVVFGRAVVGGLAADRELAIRAGGLEGVVAGPGGPVGIEVLLDRQPGADPETHPAEFQTRILFPAGGAWRDSPAERAEGPPQVALLPADGRLPKSSMILAERIAVGSGDSAGGQVATISGSGAIDWMRASAGHGAVGSLERSAAESLAASVVAAASAPVALADMLSDQRSENRIAAATTTALLGDYVPLVELLAAEGPGRQLSGTQWLGLERSAVPLAIARGPASAERYREAVEKTLPKEAAAIVDKLSIGISDEDLAGGADRWLVAALGHPLLVVRRFAAARLSEIAAPTPADRLRFRPDGPPEPRSEAIKWWVSKLEKGLIRRHPKGGLSNGAEE